MQLTLLALSLQLRSGEVRVARHGMDAPEEQTEPESSEVADSGETILVIEDQLALRRLLDRFLKQKGFRVLLAEDGLDAVERYGSGEEPVDLIITDVVMPRLGGAATVAQLRETLGDFSVIFMSGYVGEARESLSEFGERSEFIGKPFKLEKLHAKIQASLALRADPPG